MIERLRGRLPGPVRVLDVAAGSGRNTSALKNAGFEVIALDDLHADAAAIRAQRVTFDGAVSTHGLLHGTAAEISARVTALAERTASGGFVAVTFGSTSDARFGQGTRIDASTYASESGDEAGVAHAFFTRDELDAMLAPYFEVEAVEEQAGGHGVHWFVEVVRR